MKLKSNFLDFLLLFILSFSFTQAFVFFKASTFSDNLFPALFLLLIIYFLVSIEGTFFNKNKIKIDKIKIIIFIAICLITVVKTFYSAVNMRHQLGNNYPVHDNVLQLEEVVKYLKQGKNPYSENYLGTAQEAWYESGSNPALWHVVTLPFYLIASLLSSYPLEFIFDYFDQRMLHGLALLLVVFLINKIIKPLDKKIIYLTLFIFNPFFIHFFIEGRNDIFVFSLIFLSLYLLFKNKIKLSSFVLALAICTKQSSWLILPFYFFYIYLKQNQKSILAKVVQVIKKTWPFFISVLVLFVPFLLWDSKSFIEDIYLFPSGGMATSYPIFGLGFSKLLLAKGIIADKYDYFPFAILQLVIGLPIMFYLLRKQWKYNRISFLIFSYAIFLFVFWIFSRFLADNYVGYIIMLIMMGMMFGENENTKT
jgi:hypothetical protein